MGAKGCRCVQVRHKAGGNKFGNMSAYLESVSFATDQTMSESQSRFGVVLVKVRIIRSQANVDFICTHVIKWKQCFARAQDVTYHFSFKI